MTKLFRLKREKEKTWDDYQTRTSIMARKIRVQMKLPFLCTKKMRKVCGVPWCGHAMKKRMRWIDSLEKVCEWRSTRWWHAPHTRKMKDDPENHTRWKLQWGWHNRGHVWDMVATCWAGAKDWMIERKEHTSASDKYKFITYIQNKMKLPTEHGKPERRWRKKF